MLLIIIGGIGFVTWDDIKKHKLHFGRYRMQSKVILGVTSILIIVPVLYFIFLNLEKQLGISIQKKTGFWHLYFRLCHLEQQALTQ